MKSNIVKHHIDFEDSVKSLFIALGFNVFNVNEDIGFDFSAKFNNKIWAIEVKYYFTERAQISLLNKAASLLIKRFKNAKATKAMLVLSCRIEKDLREALEGEFGVVFVDRSDLLKWSQPFPEIHERISMLLEVEMGSPKLLSDRTLKDALNQTIQPQQEGVVPDNTGTELCNELLNLPKGKKTWAKYEKLCEKILIYLFPNDLLGWQSQARTDDGFNRYDLVCRIRPTSEFWQFLTQHLNSRYVLFEFKNYTKVIKQGQILTTEKYLLEKGLRKVAIIFSRCGYDDGAKAMIQGAMREHGKLILVLNDDDFCKMLHMKERGEDPSDYLFLKADSFLLSLPR